ncbi:DegV family protein [Chloroflexota bacterium]
MYTLLFDTMEYLKRGGRIDKAAALLGSVLEINPIVGLRDGKVVPIAQERSRAEAIDHLYDLLYATAILKN